MRWLDKRLCRLDRELRDHLRSSPLWREKEDLPRGVPGVGPVLSATLLAHVPELGSRSNKQIAALVGVAPLNPDSGTLCGRGTTWGGRAPVRAVLYMATIAAVRFNPEDVGQRGIDLSCPLWYVLDLTREGRDDWYPELSYAPREHAHLM